MIPSNRRDFLADVGRGMLTVSLGSTLAAELGLASSAEADEVLSFGTLEPLVALLQETPRDRLLPMLVEKLSSGTDLRTLVAAGALANARTFGGRHYDGYHTFMALAPAYQMAQDLPAAQRALPVLKVLYRNATHIQTAGGRRNEVLRPVTPVPIPKGQTAEVAIRDAARASDAKTADGYFATLATGTPEDAFNHVLTCVEDDVNVHRVVLAWRAWSMLEFTGPAHAHTLLRQTIQFCSHENRGGLKTQIQALLPRLLDQYKLAGAKPGTRTGDDTWLQKLADVVYGKGREAAAEAVAAALAEGFAPESIGEALTLAANTLLLRDRGRAKGDGAKPTGSVHGDSVGLHASDAAHAWRRIARVSSPRHTIASLIVGAYHTAGQQMGQLAEPFHTATRERVKATDPAALLKQTEDAIRTQDQARAAATVEWYGEQGYPAKPVFDLLLKYAVSEDGALHAEKYFRTVREEFDSARAPFRWRQLVALARVTASETGYPAPGVAEARTLLKI